MLNPFGLLLACCGAAPQAGAELEAVLTLELIDGEAVGAHEAARDGLLHIWVEGPGDLVLRIERAGAPALEDDDSGGRPTPYLALEVTAGERLALLVRAKEAGAAAPVDVRLVATPESDAARGAAQRGDALRREASAALKAGDRDAARNALHAALEELEAHAADATSPALAALGRELGYAAYSLGELEAAKTAWGLLYAYRERALPPHHADRLQAGGNFAAVRKALGDVAGAAEIERRVLEGLEASLPEGHETILLARQNLAASFYALGRPREALELSEHALAVAERTLPADHPRIVSLRGTVAALVGELGDPRRARALQEAQLEGLERSAASGSASVPRARMNLGLTCLELGDLAPARASIELALAELERLYPAQHPDVLVAQSSLAGVRLTVGDPEGARVLFEQLLAVRRASLPADHPDLIATEHNLASTLLELGELEAARELQEALVSADEQRLEPDHPRLLTGRLNLAATLDVLGEAQLAVEQLERILALSEPSLAADSPLRLRARLLLVGLRQPAGERSAANEELAALVADVRGLPPAHLLRVKVYSDLVASLDGDDGVPPERVREALAELVEGLRLRALECLALAPREALAVLASDERRVANALQSGARGDLATTRSLFELVETRRMIATEVERAASLVAGDHELDALARTARAARSALNDLVAGSAGSERAEAELERLVEERDRAERAIRLALEQRGGAAPRLETAALAAALEERSAAVAFLRHPLRGTDDDRLLAFVLRPDAEVERVELGSAAEIETLAARWRTALGAPLVARGLALGASAAAPSPGEPELGAALRRRLLDPVLDAAGDVRRLYVCPDDVVFLVPLDALPARTADEAPDASVARVGDRLQIATLPALTLLVTQRARATSRLLLLALGAVDYDAEGAAPLLALAAAPLARTDRSGLGFAPLPETALELAALEEVLGTSGADERVVLRGADATKAALVELAPGARYLHLATHGWFAGEQQRSVLDSTGRGAEPSFDHSVAGFAPLTLCGLALAGAGRGADAFGHVPGILTAEELAALDLSACELAVLSACETNVGLRRAGQGIRSFQTALHSAGVQTAITSLWKVDDTATRALMERFYVALWSEHATPLDALWSAKEALRQSGAPPRDWAGWVLSGKPE